MLYDVIIPESSLFFHVTVTVIVCDITLYPNPKFKISKNKNEKIK